MTEIAIPRGSSLVGALLRALRISRDEVRKVVYFALLAILGSSGLAVGLTVSNSLFLVNQGAEKLPYLFLAMPFVMVVYTPVFSFLLRRLGIDRLYRSVLILLAIGGVVIAWVLPSAMGYREAVPWALYFASLYSGMWAIGLYTLFWSFVGDFFDIRDAKRLFPILTGSQAIGASLGGLAVVALTRLGWVGELFVAWSAFAILALIPMRVIGRNWKKLQAEEEEVEEVGVGEQLKELVRYFGRERFVAVLAAALFVVMLLSSLCYFEYLAIFSSGLPDWASHGNREEALASFLGGLYGVVNVFNLVVNLFLFNPLVARLGVPRTAMILPLVYFVVFLGLAIYPGAFPIAVLGFFAFEGLLWSVDFNNQNFLFNALPSQAQKELRLVLEGFTEPVATAVVGLGLLVVQQRGTERTLLDDLGSLAWWGVGGALLAIILTFVLKIDYMRAMVVNLKRHWLDFSRADQDVVSSLTPDELERLAKRGTLADLETTRLVLRLLWQNDRARAVRLMLDLLAEADSEGSSGLAPVLGEVLEAGDDEVVRKILEKLVSVNETLPPAILDELGRHRLLRPLRVDTIAGSADRQLRAAAAVGLVNQGNPRANRRGLEIVEDLLTGDADDQCNALRILGRSGQEHYAYFLLDYVGSEVPELRREALEAVHQLATRNSNSLVPGLLRALAEKPGAQDRVSILRTLGKIGDTDSIAQLLRLAEAFGPFELRLCERVILEMGLKGVPIVVQVLRDPRQTYKARSIAARALSKLAFAQLEALLPQVIASEVDGAYEAQRRFSLLTRMGAPTAGLAVLRRLYRDQPRSSMEFILEMLSIGGQLPDYELLATALRSDNPKQRGDAIETLEQGLDRQLFRDLLPLIEDDGEIAESDVDSRAQGSASDIEELIEQAIGSPFAGEVAAAIQSIQELSSERLAECLRSHLRDHAADLPALVRRVLEERLRGDAVNTVEKLAPMATAEYFAPFELMALEPLARSAEVLELAAGRSVYDIADSARRFFLVLAGQVELGDRADGSVRDAGEVFGESALWGGRASNETATALGASTRLLSLSTETFLSSIRSDPTLALGVLEKQFLAGDVRPTERVP